MAFGARELRLILSIQSYGTGNIQRLRRDIMALDATTKVANRNQVAIQDQMLRKWEQINSAEKKVATMRADRAAKFAALEAKAANDANRFAQQRAKFADQRVAAELAAAKKIRQIRITEGALTRGRSGSEAINLEKRVAALQGTSATLATKRNALLGEQLGHYKAIHGANEAILSLENNMAVAELDQAVRTDIRLGRLQTEDMVLRSIQEAYQKNYATLRKAELGLQGIVGKTEAWQVATRGVGYEEAKVLKLVDEAAYKQARQAELLAIQQSELKRIEAVLVSITAQETKLTQAEKTAVAALERQREILHLITGEIKLQQAEVAKLVAEYSALNAELAGAGALDRREDRINRMMRRESKIRAGAHVARTAQFGGLIGLAGFSAASSSFANFNKQVTLAATQARGLDRPLSDIPVLAEAIQNGVHGAGTEIKGIIDLMKMFPATGDEMAEAAYDIFSSMTVSFGGGMKLLETFNQLAVATGSELNVAVDAGITVMNNFGRASGTVDEKLNLMITTIRYGRMRLEDLNAMLEKVAPAATASGQRLQDVAGAMVAITRLQPSQRVGATGIARLLQTFRDPDFQRGVFKVSKGVADITKGAGATGQLKALPEIIKTMAESFGLFSAQGGPSELFKTLTAVGHGSGVGRQSRIEATNAYTFLVGHVKEYLELQARATTDTGEFATALQAMSLAPGVRWEVFINQMRALILTIGEAAIPAILQFMGWVSKLVDWFTKLDSNGRKIVITLGVAASVFALFGGTIASVGFGIAAMINNMKLAKLMMQQTGVEAERAGIKAMGLQKALMGIAGVGMLAIPIVIQAMKGGDPGAWGLAMAALQGAAGGAMIGGMFGPQGAAIGAGAGALVLPITIHLMSEFQKPEDPVRNAYEAYKKEFKKQNDGGWTDMFTDALAPFGAANKVPKTVKGMASFEEWMKQNPKLVASLRKTNKDVDGEQSSLEKLIDKYYKNSNAMTKKWLKDQLDANKQIKNILKNKNDELTEAQRREIQLRKAHANAVQQAMENQKNTVKQAVDNMEQMYDQMLQDNKSAFGALGQGPVMQGMLGGIFSGINDQLRQFGVQIPVPFQIIKQDFDMQLTYFKRWRKDLAALAKRGVPAEFLAEIQAMGPEAGIPFAEGLLREGKQGFDGLVRGYKDVQDLLDKATKEDLNRKLKYWKQYGNDAAWQMIQGLIHNPRNAQLRTQFEQYIHNNFGTALQTQFKKDVAEAMAAARQDLAAGMTLPTGTGGDGGGGAGGDGDGGKPPRKPLTPAQQLHQAQTQARKASRAYKTRVDAFTAMTFAARHSMSPGGAKITEKERAPLDQLWKERQMWSRRMAQANNRVANLQNQAVVRPQLQSARRKDKETTIIHYHGDEFKVSAELTAAQFVRLARNRSWRSRHKVPRS